MSVRDRRAAFRALHARKRVFVMPNPWDTGSARLLAAERFEALATTSAGFAWSLGKRDGEVSRDELVAHVAVLAAATPLPLNVDAERCFPDDDGGVAETVRLLGEAGASGFSVEDYNPVADAIDPVGVAAERVRAAADAAHAVAEPMVVTGRAENHVHGVDDLSDTIARLLAYRDAGADVVYAPGLVSVDDISSVVREAGVPVNVLALPAGPPLRELAAVGVRRVSTGGSLARAAYGALLEGARELSHEGTSEYARRAPSAGALAGALGAAESSAPRRR